MPNMNLAIQCWGQWDLAPRVTLFKFPKEVVLVVERMWHTAHPERPVSQE